MKADALSVMALALLLSANTASAQQKKTASKTAKIKTTKSETIVIRQQQEDSKTTLEIRNGKVYINGDVVTELNGNTADINKKIVVEHTHSDAPDGDLHARKALLGVLAKADSKDGAVIERVSPNSAAEKIGLKEDDKITKDDDKEIRTAEDLIDAISRRNPGNKVTIVYERKGQEKTGIAELTAPTGNICMPGARSDQDIHNFSFPHDLPFSFDIDDFMTAPPRLGITGEDLSDESGVKIADVKAGSVAEAAGLQKGDIIYKLGGKDVTSISSLQNAVRNSRIGSPIKLKYERNGREFETEVTFTKPTRKKDL